MSNILYEDRYYNETVKKEFIEQYAEGTQKSLKRLFKVSQVIETELGKDVYEFNREELRRLFFLYMPKTVYSSKANCTWIQKYYDWALESGYTTGLNPLDTVTTEWKEQFANQVIKKFWADKEIGRIIDSRTNAQDAIVISLLWEGCRGGGNSELLNLTIRDVNKETNQLHLFDENKERRYITVSDKCIDLCLKAFRETEYDKMNGNPDDNIKAPTAQLVDNDYIIKSARTNTKHEFEAEKNIVHRRLSKVANEIGEPNFTPSAIYNSGMLHLAKTLFETTGKLEDEEYEMIFDKFNEKSEQSRYRIKNEYLNLDTLKSIYPELS